MYSPVCNQVFSSMYSQILKKYNLLVHCHQSQVHILVSLYAR